MTFYSVNHHIHGHGVVVKVQNGYATVRFGTVEKMFAVKGFEKYFDIEDKDFQKIVDRANGATPTTQSNAGASTPAPVSTPSKQIPVYYDHSRTVGSASSLLGPRSQTISVPTENLMFEIVGYMARPGRISSIEAEVPTDGRDDLFERLFPGQTYRPITMSYTPSGMPNKLSPQFRINFSDLRNCPQVLKANMGAGNGGCVGRINKSRFVLTIVENYGFRFGDWQNTSAIHNIAAERGYLEDFERGYSL